VRANHFDFRRYHWAKQRPRDSSAGVAESLRRGVGLLRRWRERSRQRQQLARLDRRMLRDIGVTPDEAERECNKPFWRA
jgi:uncharacterized protein YjiS (DUF1127 family)